MSNLEFEIISGKRINSKVLYVRDEKQCYLKKSEAKGTIYYTCYEKSCKSRVLLKNGQCSKVVDFIQHNHSDQHILYEELKALNQIKHKCLDDTSIIGAPSAVSGIRESFQSVCMSNQEYTKNINFNKIQRGLQYMASKVFAASPKTPTDIVDMFKRQNIFNNFGLTLHDGEEKTPLYKICYESKDFAYCVFGSDKIVKLIDENIPNNNDKKILIDGTFSIVPLGCFRQLILIHIEYYEKVFPVFFILANKKSTKCYAHLFNYINCNILNLNGATFMADYEASLRRAIKASFVDSQLYGCWFHFCQAVRRQITTKHKQLAQFIRHDSKASLEYHKLLSLPLLPAAHIVNAFEGIKEDIWNLEGHAHFTSFLDYFENQWLQKIGPSGISVFGTSTRTTSAVEGYNGALAKIIPKQGNFFKFVKIVQTEEFSKSRDFELLANSGGAFGKTKRKRKFLEKSELIAKANQDLSSGKITATAFINRMVFPKNGIVRDMEPNDDIFEDQLYLEDEEEEEEEDITPQASEMPRSQILCVICFEVEPNMLMIPCKHLKTCNACVLKLQAKSIAEGLESFNCPICREKVNDTIQVFL